jgi:hypothetical protein
MTTQSGAGAGREPSHEARRHGDDREALISTRTLMIVTVAGVVGLLADISAGVAAGIQATTAAGAATSVALGLIAGIVGAIMTGGAVAATLHVLVGPPD